MALSPGAEIRVAWRYTYLGQKCENVQTYIAQGAAVIAVTVDQLCEALWNDYKARYKAVMSANRAINTFDSLLGDEVGGSLAFGEFAIPFADQLGDRLPDATSQWLNSFSAVGVRQTVGSRLTRPGQKRFPFLNENDVSNNAIEGATLALFDALGGAFSQPSALGSPAVGVAMQPVVVHEPGVRDPVRHVQDVIGWVTNPNLTSQVSRKLGRGI